MPSKKFTIYHYTPIGDLTDITTRTTLYWAKREAKHISDKYQSHYVIVGPTGVLHFSENCLESIRQKYLDLDTH